MQEINILSKAECLWKKILIENMQRSNATTLFDCMFNLKHFKEWKKVCSGLTSSSQRLWQLYEKFSSASLMFLSTCLTSFSSFSLTSLSVHFHLTADPEAAEDPERSIDEWLLCSSQQLPGHSETCSREGERVCGQSESWIPPVCKSGVTSPQSFTSELHLRASPLHLHEEKVTKLFIQSVWSPH